MLCDWLECICTSGWFHARGDFCVEMCSTLPERKSYEIDLCTLSDGIVYFCNYLWIRFLKHFHFKLN